MNKNLIQISNNLSAVTDEDGNVDIISKENNNYNFKGILKEENRLETYNNF